jgi:hypothetical protein
MEILEGSIKEFLAILRPHITAFSEQLPLNFNHGDEVIVGGEVISVFDANQLDGDLSKPEFGAIALPTNDFGVYITIDDKVGQTSLVVFQSVYIELLEKLKVDSLVGKVVIAKGQFAQMNKSTRFMTENAELVDIDKHPDKETLPRVLCYTLNALEQTEKEK